jgi:UDP-N-acetyl-D-galactosamine dehydrogenase
LTRCGIVMSGVRVLVLGFAFKENCPDLRNTRVVDIVNELREYDVHVDIHDPWVSTEEAHREYGVNLIDKPQPNTYDAVVLAVAHRQFAEMGVESIRALGKENHVLYDLKYVFAADASDIRL